MNALKQEDGRLREVVGRQVSIWRPELLGLARRAYLLSGGREPCDAEDIVQEAVLRLLRSDSEIDFELPLLPLLRNGVRWESSNRARISRRQAFDSETDEAAGPVTETTLLKVIVEDFFFRLNELDQAILRLYSGGWKVAEIARHLRRPPRSISDRLYSMRKEFNVHFDP